MYLWDLEALVDHLRAGRATQKELLKYLLAYLFLGWSTGAISAGIFALDMQAAISALAVFGGTVLCYRANSRGDGRDFIVRYLCLQVPLLIRFIVLYFVLAIFIGFGIEAYRMAIGTTVSGHLYLYLIIFLRVIYFAYLYAHIARMAASLAAGHSGPVNSPPQRRLMYLWDLAAVSNDLRAIGVPPKATLKALLLFLVVIAPLCTFAAYNDIFFLAVATIVVFGSTILCYQANNRGDGNNFLERYICLQAPLALRLLVYSNIFFLSIWLIFRFTTSGGLALTHSVIAASLIIIEIIYFASLRSQFGKLATPLPTIAVLPDNAGFSPPRGE